MSSDENETPAEAPTEEASRRADRLSLQIIGAQAGIALYAVFALAWWATGHRVWTPAWVAFTAVLAVTNIYAQLTIRAMRLHIRIARAQLDVLREYTRRALDRLN